MVTYCPSSVALGRPYCRRPQGSVVVDSLEVMLSAALLNSAGLIRLPTNPWDAGRVRCTPALHAGEAKAVKSPASIAAVGTNALLSVGFTVVFVPW